MKMNRTGLSLLVTACAAACLALGACAADSKKDSAPGEKTMSADNALCPYSGRPVDASFGTVGVGDKNIAFCCGGCKGKFEALDNAKRTEMLAKMNAPK